MLRNNIHQKDAGPIWIKQSDHIEKHNRKHQQNGKVYYIFRWEDFTE